jgi:hypothetical protein
MRMEAHGYATLIPPATLPILHPAPHLPLLAQADQLPPVEAVTVRVPRR